MTAPERLVNLLSMLRRVFFNRLSFIQTRNGPHRLPIESRHSYWIVGRDLCMYRCEEFANIPRSRRRSALELKLPVWSPFERTGHHCVWSGSSAMVWYWDEDTVNAGRETSKAPNAGSERRSSARVRVFPETMFYPKKPDGVHLQVCRKGFELQHWRAGVLADAFWCPERPHEGQWGWFIDRQEIDGQTVPTVRRANSLAVESAMEAKPWSISLTPREWIEVNERGLAAACLLALSLVVVWQEARIWRLRHIAEAGASELTRIQAELGPLLEARNNLLRLRRTNQALLDLLNEPSQARIMSLVDRAIPSAEAKFRKWRYQQGELRVLVEDPELGPIAYVRSLEAVPLFGQVRAEPTRGENRIEIVLKVGG